MNNAHPTTVAANLLILNKRCEFIFSSGNVWVPMAACPAGRLADTLNAIAAAQVTIQFHTTEKPEDVAADLKKFGKRLTGLQGWARSEWTVSGRIVTCTLMKVAA